MPRVRKITIILLSFSLFIFNPTTIFAQTSVSLDLQVLKLDKATVKKGYTAKFNKNFSLAISPQALAGESEVIFKDFYNPEEIAVIPENLKIVSHLYEFDIVNEAAYDGSKPLIIEIRYPEDRDNYKRIYYWDGVKSQWLLLPTQTLIHYGQIKAKIYLSYARLGVFEDNLILQEGPASWYRYRDCDCAASPDYPKGAKLKITNLENNKTVVVTVNDYGPDRTVHPDRLLDLDLVAFKKIASKTAGLIKIKIEPVNEMAVAVAKTEEQATSTLVNLIRNEANEKPDFQVHSQAAIVVKVKNNEVLWAKNEAEILPIASLTKLMTAEIFLQHNPGWNKVVSYKKSDDDVLNYAKRWEMGYLKVKPGESMTAKDLFYTSLVGSANNAAYTLARATGLLRSDFVNAMNYQAGLWGMTETKFIEPSGLDPHNISSARDLAKMGLLVFKKIDFLKSTTLKQYNFSTLETKESHLIKNRNPLLTTDLYLLGSKTGYLDEAGYCLISKVRANKNSDEELIIVVLGAEKKQDTVNDTLNLAKWGLEKIKNQI
jgi:rare lipoprotein A